jgi:hypothetical protein
VRERERESSIVWVSIKTADEIIFFYFLSCGCETSTLIPKEQETVRVEACGDDNFGPKKEKTIGGRILATGHGGP